MSEGELKKRILEASPFWHYKEGSNERCDCQIQWLYEILDEVAKAAPIGVDSPSWRTWFLKYFGEQK